MSDDNPAPAEAGAGTNPNDEGSASSFKCPKNQEMESGEGVEPP